MMKFLALSLSYIAFIMLINVKMPTTVGILTFMSMINFVLNWVEHGKCFITSGHGIETVCYGLSVRISTLCMLGNFSCFCCTLLAFFKIIFFRKIFQEHSKSIKWFGFRFWWTFSLSWSVSKLFAKVISRQQKSPLARNELRVYMVDINMGESFQD